MLSEPGVFEQMSSLCSLFLFYCDEKRKSEPKKKNTQSISALPDGIALTEWTYIPFASQTKSFLFCYCAVAHAKRHSVTHVSESDERAQSAIVSINLK